MEEAEKAANPPDPAASVTVDNEGKEKKKPLRGLREKLKEYIQEVAAEFPMKPPKFKVIKDMLPPGIDTTTFLPLLS